MNTISLKLSFLEKNPWQEILTAELADAGFYAFEESEETVIAYANESEVDLELIKKETLDPRNDVGVSYEIELLPFQNWNAVWEADFQPVFVGEKLSILAPFHDPALKKELNIEIQPQMSFGTGHHQTTWMMANAMLSINPFPKTVLDMGTGTGVLAILAEKLGANFILAIDIEPWSAENTIDNANRNQASKIETLCGDVDLLKDQKFDLILANINKNVLKAHLNSYFRAINEGGLLLLSGFFDSDASEMIAFTEKIGFTFVEKQERETWSQLTFKR
jgi:ribosomal protein L11 methyltransferase